MDKEKEEKKQRETERKGKIERDREGEVGDKDCETHVNHSVRLCESLRAGKILY